VSGQAIDFRVPALAALHADVWTAPFWAGAAEHVLRLPRCSACGTFRTPGAGICWRCRNSGTEWPELEPRGTVFTYTVVRHAVMPEVREQIPYVIAVIEMCAAPEVRLIGNLWRVEPDAVWIGQPVEIVWDDVADGVTIPRFTPATSPNGPPPAGPRPRGRPGRGRAGRNG